MYPVLFEYRSFVIHTYGVAAAAGFGAAIIVAVILGKKEGIKKEDIKDLGFYIVLSAVAGARLFYFFVEPEYFIQNPLEIFKIWKGGLVFYGGFLFALAAALIFIKKRNLSLASTADAAAPAIALGHFAGRLGCFFAGCCYGKPVDSGIGLVFTHPQALAPLGQSLHPTQLYSAGANFVLFIILISFFFIRTRKGSVFLLYLFLYGILRIFIEFFRGDNRGALIFDFLSVSQFLGLLAALTAVVIFVYQLFKKNGRNQK